MVNNKKMSDKGKLHRGEKWERARAWALANNKPDNVSNDSNKMVDVEFYLDSLKETKSKKEK